MRKTTNGRASLWRRERRGSVSVTNPTRTFERFHTPDGSLAPVAVGILAGRNLAVRSGAVNAAWYGEIAMRRGLSLFLVWLPFLPGACSSKESSSSEPSASGAGLGATAGATNAGRIGGGGTGIGTGP